MHHQIVAHCTLRYVTGTTWACIVVIFYDNFYSAIFSECREHATLIWCQGQVSCTIRLLPIARSGLWQAPRAHALLWSFTITFVALFLASTGDQTHFFDARVKSHASSDCCQWNDQVCHSHPEPVHSCDLLRLLLFHYFLPVPATWRSVLMQGSSLMHHQIIAHVTIAYVTGTTCQCIVVIFCGYFCYTIFRQCRELATLF